MPKSFTSSKLLVLPRHLTSKLFLLQGYYLEINLNTLKRITHLATQGGSDLNYVKEFFVRLYGEDKFWKDYQENGLLKVSNTRLVRQYIAYFVLHLKVPFGFSLDI